MKILILTDFYEYAIGNIFASSLKTLGHEVIRFDLHHSINRYVRLGKFGRGFQNFVPVDAWIRKGNKDLAILIKEYKPDQIIISGNIQVLYGTIAFAKSILPDTRITLFWPDTFVNLTQIQLNLSKLVDKLVSYSSHSLTIFEQLGFKNVEWMPFAGDVNFLGEANWSIDEYKYDVSFIGGWRPEREKAIEVVVKNFPQLKYKIVGGDWKKNVKKNELTKYLESTQYFARQYGDFIRQSRINLNIIDDTNFPAANMRFFEIPVAGGLQLCSPCPEQENIFINDEHIFYFKDDVSLCEKIELVIRNEDKASRVRKNGNGLAVKEHTYIQRVQKLIS